MRRDPLHLGQQDLVFHPTIYLENMKIIDGELCFSSKIIGRIYDFFSLRYRLFSHLYSNPKASGYDLLISDIFLEANQYFKFEETIFDPERYLKLDNRIMHQFKEIDDNPRLIELMDKITRREHYRKAGDSLTLHFSSFRKLDRSTERKYFLKLLSCHPQEVKILQKRIQS